MSIQLARLVGIKLGDPGQAELVNAAGESLTIDTIHTSLTTISEVHHEVQEGHTYSVSAYNGTLANNAALAMLLTVPIAVTGHLVFEAGCGGDAELQFYENTQVSNVGTALLARNMKRPSGRPADIVPTQGPTVTAAGALLLNRAIPGGTGGNAAGGTARQNTEWIVAQSLTYLIRMWNRSGNAKISSLIAQWYEEPVQ